jgi:hypothetical protein
MTSMKRRTAIAVTVGVWLAAVGSAAALTYDLNRPLRSAGATIEGVPTPSGAQVAAPLVPAHAALSEPPSVLYVSTLPIVGAARHLPVAPGGRKPITEISQMRCADWRELNMGSGQSRCASEPQKTFRKGRGPHDPSL